MISAKEAHELSVNSIGTLCDIAIKDAARAGSFRTRVSLKDRNYTDLEVREAMKKLHELGYLMLPRYIDNRIYIGLNELVISWR